MATELEPPKRALPDFMQKTLEGRGVVFNAQGQIVSWPEQRRHLQVHTPVDQDAPKDPEASEADPSSVLR